MRVWRRRALNAPVAKDFLLVVLAPEESRDADRRPIIVLILGIVVGQAVGGLIVDRVGIGPGGPKPLSAFRIGGT